MSRIDEMIARGCPDGVDYKKLGEVCVRQRGTSITAAQMKKIATDEGESSFSVEGRPEFALCARALTGRSTRRPEATTF